MKDFKSDEETNKNGNAFISTYTTVLTGSYFYDVKPGVLL